MVRAVFTAVTAVLSISLRSASAAILDVGENHVCVVDGSDPKCWGENKYGQLGRQDGTTSTIGDDSDEMGDNLVAVAVGEGVSDVALGDEHTCALLESGAVVCFGRNHKGQLGLEDTTDRGEFFDTVRDAVDLGTGLSAEAIAAGCDHTCVLLDDGSVKCFGYNNYGQLGQGTKEHMGDDPGEMGDNLPAVQLGQSATAIAAGCDFTCALLSDGDVVCWGRNKWGQLGTGDDDDRLDDEGLGLKVVDLGDSTVTAIAAGEGHVCALLDNNSVKCWGYNNDGQLGLGDNDDRGDDSDELGSALPAVSLGTADVPIAIDCGSSHTCVLLQSGSVKCFGDNSNGQLGNGNTSTVGKEPTDMGDNLVAVGISSASHIAAGGSVTCANLSNNDVICWGRGNEGQLGQGDDDNISDLSDVEPVDI